MCADFKNDPYIYAFDSLKHIGIELWQVKSGTLFDNILITDNPEYAKNFAERPGASTKMLRRLPLMRLRKRGLRRNLQALMTTMMTLMQMRMRMMRTMTRLIILLPMRPRTLLTQKARSLLMKKPAEGRKDASAEKKHVR